MKASELLNLIVFKDSVINKFTYKQKKKKLLVDIDLYNSRQPSSDEPNYISGQIIFSGIKKCILDKNLKNIKKNIACKLMDIMVTEEGSKFDTVKLTIELSDNNHDHVMAQCFSIKEIDWLPDLIEE